MSKDIWHITNQDENTTDVPEEEGFVVLIGHWTSCLWYGGETPEPIFWENVKKWCYLDDLLALETESKDISDKIGKLEPELDRTRKALDVARHTIGWINQMIDEHADKQAIKIKCEYALQKITALEQKDK